MANVADLVISQYDPAKPLNVRQWSTFSVDDQLQITNKINLIIQTLNQYGKLNNDVVTDWNKVMNWVSNEGMTTEVDAVLQKWHDDGTLSNLINSLMADIATFNDYSNVITRDLNGNVSQIQLMDDTNVIQTTTITRDSNGNVTSVQDVANGKTATTTINRSSDGTVLSTSKVVI